MILEEKCVRIIKGRLKEKNNDGDFPLDIKITLKLEQYDTSKE